MKNTVWALIIGMVIMGAVVGYDQARREKLKKAKEWITNPSEYQRGFMEGMGATIRHVKIDTNTGKASLELSDVLAEMKPPTNAPTTTNSWPSKSPKKSN